MTQRTSQRYNPGGIVLAAAEKFPDRVLFRLPQSRILYAEMRNLIITFALHLRRHGVGRGTLVAIDCKYPSASAAAVLAIGLLGGRWVSATRTVLGQAELGVGLLIHDGSSPYPDRDRVIKFDRSWSNPPPDFDNSQIDFEGYASENDPWVLAQSSGTTGEPKVMELSYRTVVERAETFDIAEGLGGERIVLGVSTPPLALGSILPILRVVRDGGTLVHSSDYDFLRGAGVNIVGGTPIQHVNRVRLANKPQPGARVAHARVGGAKASKLLLDTLTDYYDNVTIAYGSMEAGVICARSVSTDNRAFDDLGPPMDGARIEIVNEDDTVLPPETEGIVRVQSRFMARGYLGDDATTRRAFRGGWFYPGDLGTLSATGSLRITGRIDDRIEIGGVKVNAILMDQTIEAVPGVREGICFTQPGEHEIPIMAALIVPDDPGSAADAAKRVREAVATNVSDVLVPRIVYATDAIPRTERGKPRRREAIDVAANAERY